jgi:hypothetical protein
MAIVIGILLLGLGAILVWGLDHTVGGIDVATIGVILMAVGGVGILASFLASPRATRTGGGGTSEPAWEGLAPVPEKAAKRQRPTSDERPPQTPRSRTDGKA